MSKSRPVYYVAHPVAPTAAEIAVYADDPMGSNSRAVATLANVYRLGRWLKWLRKTWPEITFIAPWAVGLLLGADDSDPAQRESALVDCLAVVPRCTGVVLVGGRIGTGGTRERNVDHNVVDMLHLGAEPPTTGYVNADWKWVS